MKTTCLQTRRGFTLIELLVVIGVIALLIGILLPVLAKARKSAKTAVCISNMRQLALATTGYANDYDRKYPQPTTSEPGLSTADRNSSVWFNALDYYLQQEARSGTAADRNYETFKQDPVWLDLPQNIKVTSGSVLAEPEKVRTIKMNAFFGWVGSTTPSGFTANDVQFFKDTQIPNPSNTLVYVDGRAHDTPSVTTGNSDYTAASGGGSGSFAALPLTVGLRHEDGVNGTQADGSASYHKNPIRETGAGYRGWYDEDEPERPDVLFNFDERAL